MIQEDATKEAYGYYSTDLKPQSHRLIVVACERCGIFRIYERYAYSTFCQSCSQILGEAKKGEKSYMFNKCGEDSPRYKGGQVKCVCLQCSKEFYVDRGVKVRGGGKYCCRSCVTKATIHKIQPIMTAPEIKFQCICDKCMLPFKFVGNGALWLGNANPDFIHTDKKKKIVVEVFGDYFHSPLLKSKIKYVHTFKGRQAQLKQEGYKCIIIWESDLMRSDAKVFVLQKLKKEGVI